MQLTEQQVVALAPDAQVATAGKKLGTEKPWSNVGRSARALWGECKGSGSKPYQVRVDRTDLAAKCSCPSRKFPCKHAVGLLLLIAAKPETAAEAEEPQWVSEWLDKRADAQEQKQKRAQAPTEVDEAAQQKRQEKRDKRIDDGVSALALWLADLMRRGLAQVGNEGPAFWEKQAARLVDAQVPGLANRLRALGEQVGAQDDWPGRVLDGLGQLALLIQAWQRREQLSPELRRELELQLGQTMREADVAAQSTPMQDEWQVIAQETENFDRLRVRRTWLLGQQSKRYAMLQHTAVHKQPFAENYLPGSTIRADLHFWPGPYPLRAMTGGNVEMCAASGGFSHAETVAAFLERQADALAANPWLPRLPLVLDDVAPLVQEDGWWAVDTAGTSLPVHAPNIERLWNWMALCGGVPHRVAGEWRDGTFSPLGLYVENRFVALEG